MLRGTRWVWILRLGGSRALALAMAVALIGTLAPPTGLVPHGVGPVAQAQDSQPRPIPPAPEEVPPDPDPELNRRFDLEIPPLPEAPDLTGLRGRELFEAIDAHRDVMRPRRTTHKNPKRGEDPRNPAVVRARNNVWLLFFLDDAGNLYQQRNPGTALEPFWQSGNVLVTGPVDHPDVVRRDDGPNTTLGLTYLKTVSSVKQVMLRTSTNDGQAWGAETQVTTETINVYWQRVLNIGGTIYLFWSDNDLTGKLYYRTTTDFSSWTAKTEVGHLVGPTKQATTSTFDIAKLANGTWILAWQDIRTDCSGGGCNDYNYPVVYTAIGTDLATWGAATRHTDQIAQRSPGTFSVLQDGSGSVYLAYDRYEYPHGRYVRLRIGDSAGGSWGTEITYGCEWSLGCSTGYNVSGVHPYLFLDDLSPAHVQSLWEMSGGAAISDPYPAQLFLADLTAALYYRPLPPYMDPAVTQGAGALGDEHVNVANGNLIWAEEDYRLGGVGPETTLTRSYNGGDLRDGIFGFGWAFPYTTGVQENSDGSVTIANFDGRRDYYLKDGSNYVSPAGTETALVDGGIGGWILTYKDHTKRAFDRTTGKLSYVEDPDGNRTTLTYTGGRLTTITDQSARTFTLTYNGQGRVSSIAIPLARTLSYGYDANGNLTSFTDAAGNVTAYGYGSDHRLTSVTDATGRVTTVAWTSVRRVKSLTDLLGAVTSYRYTSSGSTGGTTTVTDPRNTQTIHTFDSRHRQTKIEVVMPGGSANNLVTTFAYNSDDQVTSTTDPRGTVTTFQYDSKGNVTQKVEDSGTGKLNLTWGYVYTNNDLTQSTDPRGAVTDYAYDAEHHLTSRTLHLATEDLVWSYTYLPSGLLQTTKDPKGQATGNVETNQYDPDGYLATRTDAAGQTEYFDYDRGGRLLSHTDKRGKVWTYGYDNADRLTSETDPLSHVTSYGYSGTGEQISATDPRGVVTTGVYQRDGELVVTSRDAGSTGFRITNGGFELGATGWTTSGSPSIVTTSVLTGAKAAKVHLTAYYHREVPVTAAKRYGVTAYAIATAAGQTARLRYEWRRSDHTVISSANVDVSVVTTGYLPLRLDPIQAPTDSAFLYLALQSTATNVWVNFDDVAPTHSQITDYDKTASRTSVLDANGNVTRSGYDAASRLTSVTDARGKVTTGTLDKNGNVTRLTDPLSHITDFVYDAIDRQTRRTADPSGLALVTNQAYDAVGNLTSVTDPDNRTTTYEYDKADRLTKVTDAKSGVTTYGYDKNGNRTSATNARSKTRTAAYDDVNRLTEVRDALNRLTSYGYDGNGNRTSRIDALTRTTTYGYDNASRLTSVTYPGPATVTFTYDDADRMLTMVDVHGTTTWAYDDLDRVSSVTQPTVGQVTYGYDRVGNRTSLGVPGKTVTYAYNEVNRLSSVTDWASRTTSYTYDNAERMSAITFPTTVSAAYAYDNADRLTGITYTKDSSTILSFTYTLNGSGQKLTEVGPSGTTSYQYDELHRLTQVTYPDSAVESFTYDAVGNRLNRSLGGSSTSYEYDDADQLSSHTTGGSTTSYTYSANGNRVTKVLGSTTTTYSYDFEDRLTKIEEGAATLGEHRYDGAGNRYAKIVGAQTLTYTLDLASELTEVLGESDGTTYVYGADLVAMDRSGTTSWYLPDGLGSTRKVTDTTGTIVAGYEYEAFGKVRSSTGNLTNDVRFTGERTDQESGLLFLRARHYDPEVGRFLQADKWPYDERNSQDLNRYAYVRNDPVNAVDPTGRWFETLFDIASFAMSFADFAQRPSLETAAWAIADAVAIVLPVPGAGTIKRTAGALGDIFGAGRRTNAVAEAGYRSSRAATNSSRTTRSSFGVTRGFGASAGSSRAAQFSRRGSSGFQGAGSQTTWGMRRAEPPSVRTPQAGRASADPPGGFGSADTDPEFLYRSGNTNPGNLTPRPEDSGKLSTRTSLSNPWPHTGRPVFEPGEPWMKIDTSRLPPGAVTVDNIPPGHATIDDVPWAVVREAVVDRGRFPK